MVIFPIQHVEIFIFIFSWYNLISDGSIWPDDIHLSLSLPWSTNISPSIIHEILFFNKILSPPFSFFFFHFVQKRQKQFFGKVGTRDSLLFSYLSLLLAV